MEERQIARQLLIFGPVALVALIALTLLVTHSPGSLEKRIGEGAQQALASGGFGWASATAQGSTVVLDGLASTEGDKSAAEAAARSAPGVGGVDAAKLDVAPMEAPYRLTAKKTDGSVTIEGAAPNSRSLQAITEAAGSMFGGKAVVKLHLASGAPAGVTWEIAAMQAFDALSKLETGEAELADDALTLTSSTRNEAAIAVIRDKFSRPSNGIHPTLNLAAPAEWSAVLKDGVITISGKSGTAANRTALAKAAGAVEDTSTAGAEAAGWVPRALAALPALKTFTSGELAVEGDVFRISGSAPASAQKWLREDMDKVSDRYRVVWNVTDAAMDIPELSGLDLVAPDRRRSDCSVGFGRLIKKYPVGFAPGSDTIPRSEGATMDRLAALAKRCDPLAIEVRAYTDNVGNKAALVARSQKQAEAVVAWLAGQGIASGRLTAVGYGPADPVADNRTPNGRAANRRIEFKVTGGNGQ